MKKIYKTIFALLLITTSVEAQLSLTQSFNQPALGDIYNRKGLDSVGNIPKNTGSNQTWNFSAFTQNTVTLVRTYSNTAAVPSSSAYAGCNLVEDQSGGNYVFIKTSTTPTAQMELLGIENGTVVTFNFTNSAIAAIWPVNFGYNQTDNFSGTANSLLGSGTVSGTLNSQATGTGTLNLPGAVNLSNILQTRVTQTINSVLGSAPFQFTLNIQATNYSYYHSTNKFPVVEVEYQKQTLSSITGPTVTNSATTRINSAFLVTVGLENKTSGSEQFDLYPNPATESISILMPALNQQGGFIYLYNNMGAIVKIVEIDQTVNKEKEISLNGLSKGIYFVKIQNGEHSLVKKLIIN